jgi:hypothetical protein
LATDTAPQRILFRLPDCNAIIHRTSLMCRAETLGSQKMMNFSMKKEQSMLGLRFKL